MDRPALPWLPFLAIGAVAILAGGLVAAAGGEAPSGHLSWVSAYLVLVCGCAQILLGAGRFFLSARSPTRRLVWLQAATFNLGNVGVLAGTLLGEPTVLYVASAVLVVALGLFAWDTRGGGGGRRGWTAVYRLGVVVLAVSVPVGNVLGR